MPKSAAELIQNHLNTKGKIPDLANRLDAARGCSVEEFWSGCGVEASIPSLFTDKNRLSMAIP
jgi:hypothetical protein